MPEAAPVLVKLEHPDQVVPGDTVYEVIRFGVGENHVKHKPYKVKRIERQACLCQQEGGDHREIKLHFKHLMIEQKPERVRPALALVEQLPTIEDEDDVLSSWGDMGKELVEDLAHQAKELEEERGIENEVLGNTMAEHQRRITEIEAQLKAARQDMEKVRLEHKARLDDLDAQQKGLLAKRDKVLKALKALAAAS